MKNEVDERLIDIKCYCQKIYFSDHQAEKRTAEVVGRGGGSGEGEEMQEEDEATLLVLGCLAGGLGVLVLVGLVGGLVVRGRRTGGGGRPNLTLRDNLL